MTDTSVAEELRKYRALATTVVATLIVSVTLFVQFLGVDRTRAVDAFRSNTEHAAAISGIRISLLLERLEAIGREHLMMYANEAQLLGLVQALGIDTPGISLCARRGDAIDYLLATAASAGVTGESCASDPQANPSPAAQPSGERHTLASGLGMSVSVPDDGRHLEIRLFGSYARELRVRIAPDALLELLVRNNAGLDQENATACVSLRVGTQYRQLGCTTTTDEPELHASFSQALPGTYSSRQEIEAAGLRWRMVATPNLRSLAGTITLVPFVMFGMALAIGTGACVFAYRSADKNIRLDSHAKELRARLEELQQLETQNGLLDQFAAMAAHDLQAPLRFIVSKAHLLVGELEDLQQHELAAMAETQVEQGERMHSLILDLLEFCRAGQNQLTISPVNVRALVEQEVAMLKAHVEYADTRINLGALPEEMSCDAEKLSHIVRNLLGNAAKFSQKTDSPTISIAATRDERHGPWTFRIRDNGPGVDEGQHHVIFRPFARLDATTTGTGMGLAIVKIMIEQHGGTIWIENVAPTGSTFCFTMPSATPVRLPA